MAANAAPLILGGMALLFMSRRSDEDEAAPALPEPHPPMVFSCDTLVGVWHKKTDGLLPVTIAAYEDAYEYMQFRLVDSNGEDDKRVDLISGALDHIASGCHWEDQLQYTDRMKDVYDAMQVIHRKVLADFIGQPSEGEG